MANIEKRPSGVWRARYYDDAGKQHAKRFPRKVDAKAWLDTVTASVVRGDYVDPSAGRVTFTSFYEDWRERQVWVAGTRRAMDLAAGSVGFGDVPLGRVRKSHVESWVKAMVVDELAVGTIHTRAQNVRSVLRAAVEDRVISRDPSVGVRLPRQRRSEVAMSIPTPEQVGRILRAADVDFAPFIALCAFAGLRLGEASGVQVGDVDFLRRELAVSRQVQRVKGGGLDIRAPKYGSERTVFLAKDLVTILARHVEQYPPREGGWLFGGLGDKPPAQTTISAHWRATLKRAGLSGLRLHDLRHFYASGLIASGCDVVTVQRALGHSMATTTLNTYSHLWPTAEDRTRKAADAMLTEALTILKDSPRTQAGS
jgi:integrase